MNRIFLLIIGLVASGTVAFAVEQPVRFNHARHTKDNGLECSVCHTRYSEHAVSGRPRIETCSMCHSATMGDSPEAEKVHQYVERGEEIPWQRLYQVPLHVRYSHARHVTVAGIECNQCHGPIGETTEPPAQPLVQIKMDLCVNCHRSRNVTTDCLACHR